MIEPSEGAPPVAFGEISQAICIVRHYVNVEARDHSFRQSTIHIVSFSRLGNTSDMVKPFSLERG